MKQLIEQLNGVYQFAINNEHSNLYRELYGPNRPKIIDTLHDWHGLEPISKSVLTSMPFIQRLFMSYSEIDMIRITSGTTGSKPLLLPRKKYVPYTVHFSVETPSTCLLNFWQPHHTFREIRHLGPRRQNIPLIISGDPSDLSGSVALAARAGVDHVVCMVSMLELLIPYVRAHDLNSQIKHIELGGERLEMGQYLFFKKEFPNADIYSNYGLTETAIAGTDITSPNDERAFLPLRSHYWELIKEDGSVCTHEGDEGEILITTLWQTNNPLPLIRYRTGDIGRLVTTHADPWQCTYNVLGRIQLDIIKVAGGELKIAEVARVVQNLHPSLTEDFELHFFVETVRNVRKPKVELRIKTPYIPSCTDAFIEEIAQKIAERLRVAPTFTYYDGVKKGIYSPLIFTPVSTFEISTGKRKRFFRYD